MPSLFRHGTEAYKLLYEQRNRQSSINWKANLLKYNLVVAKDDVGRSFVRSLRIGPLLVAIAVCVLFALFGSALVGESLGNWYGALDKPWFLVPL